MRATLEGLKAFDAGGRPARSRSRNPVRSSAVTLRGSFLASAQKLRHNNRSRRYAATVFSARPFSKRMWEMNSSIQPSSRRRALDDVVEGDGLKAVSFSDRRVGDRALVDVDTEGESRVEPDRFFETVLG